MTNFIPIFPLNLVVYPGEDLNLHIFEPRYKQLIGECVEQKKNFGIPSVVKDKMADMGTVMEVKGVVKVYDNGEMDIKTRGLNVFRILEAIPVVPDKFYGGAIVKHIVTEDDGDKELMRKVVRSIRQLHGLLHVEKSFPKPDEQLTSYDVAHHVGLSLEEEYELLGLEKELQRQEYIRRHLKKVIPVVMEMEGLKERVKLNGHFKNLKGFQFEM
jgi:Lon protease-like protein